MSPWLVRLEAWLDRRPVVAAVVALVTCVVYGVLFHLVAPEGRP